MRLRSLQLAQQYLSDRCTPDLADDRTARDANSDPFSKCSFSHDVTDKKVFTRRRWRVEFHEPCRRPRVSLASPYVACVPILPEAISKDGQHVRRQQ